MVIDHKSWLFTTNHGYSPLKSWLFTHLNIMTNHFWIPCCDQTSSGNIAADRSKKWGSTGNRSEDWRQWLIPGWWYTYSEKWWSSSNGIIVPKMWKVIKAMFQTTNQLYSLVKHGNEQSPRHSSMSFAYKWPMNRGLSYCYVWLPKGERS